MFGEQKKLRTAKIGYVRITSELSGEAFDSPEGKKIEKGIKELLEKDDVEIIDGVKTVNYFDNAIEVARQMQNEDVDGVVIFITSWMESTTGHTFVKELGKIPVLFWSYTTYKTGDTVDTAGSFTGFAVLKGALDRLGVKYSMVVGSCSSSENEKELSSFINVARAVKKMDRARIGLIGYFGLGMYSASIDNLLMKQKIGPEIISIDELEFMDLVDNVKDSDIEELKKYLKENTDIDPLAGEEIFGKMVSLYFAFDALVEKYKLDAINPRCHYGLSSKCMPCISLGLLSDRNIVTGCESDILISVSMLLHYYLSEEVITYFDIIDFDNESIYFSNCGFSPLSFVPGRPKLTYCDPKDWGFGGLTNGNLMKQGQVDMLRLYEKINKYDLLYSKGSTVETVVRGNKFPTMKVKFENVSEFIKYVPSQHISIAYSNIKKELELFCGFKGIELHSV